MSERMQQESLIEVIFRQIATPACIFRMPHDTDGDASPKADEWGP